MLVCFVGVLLEEKKSGWGNEEGEEVKAAMRPSFFSSISFPLLLVFWAMTKKTERAGPMDHGPWTRGVSIRRA